MPYGHKPDDCKCGENKKETDKEDKTEKMITKRKVLMVYPIIVDKKSIGVLNAKSKRRC